MGDPLLTVSGDLELASEDVGESKQAVIERPTDLQALDWLLEQHAKEVQPKTFEEYQEAHPEFFSN